MLKVQHIEIKPFISVSEVSKRSLEIKNIAKNTTRSEEIIEMHESLMILLHALEKVLSDDLYKDLETLDAKVLSQMR
ncbi:MAG: hypothetical protein ACI8WT_003123 [Clostridium sp.]